MATLPLKLLDRAKEACRGVSTGTPNSIILQGPAAGFVAISGIEDGTSTYYTLQNGNTWEVGLATYATGAAYPADQTAYGRLIRGEILDSSNSGNEIALASDDTADVFITLPASKSIAITSGTVLEEGSVLFSDNGSGIVDGSANLTYSGSPLTLNIHSGNLSFNTGTLDQLLFRNDIDISGGDPSIVRIGYTEPGEQFTSSLGVAIGYYAGGKNAGTRNIAIGHRANYNNATSYYVCSVGDQAGLDSYSNNFSTNVGYVAGYYSSGTTQSNFGMTAGYMAKGEYLINIGYKAGQQSVGDNSVYIGQLAGYKNEGNNNIEIVTNSGIINNNFSNRVNIENVILADTADKLVAIGDVGTGTLTTSLEPNAMLDVITTGAIGTTIPVFRVAGTGGNLISTYDNVSTGVIFSVSDIDGLPLIAADASGDVTLIENGRYVGIATGTPQYQLDVNGTGNFASGILLPNGTNVDSNGNVSIGTDNTLSAGPMGPTAKLIMLNPTDRGNILLGDPGALTVPDNASGWLIMNHGASHNGGVITGVNILDTNTITISGTPMTIINEGGEAQLSGAESISSETMAVKGINVGSVPFGSPVAANVITFNDGTTQSTSATGCCSGISTDVTTIETALNGITGCGLSCTGVTGEFAFAQDVTFYEDVEFHDAAYFWEWTTFDNSISVMPGHTLYLDRVTFNCGGAGYTSIECTGNGNLNIPSGNVYINNTYQTGIYYDIDVENNAYFTSIGINQTNINASLDIRSLSITDIDLRIQQIANQTANFIEIVDVNNNMFFNIDASGDANLSGCLNASGCITTTGDLTVGGDITVEGNLNVSGSLTYIDSTTVTIADKQLELASNSGTAIGNDTAVDDGGLVLKSSDGDKKWTWQNNAFWDEWLSSEHVGIAADKALRLGPTCAGSPGRLITFNWTNRGNLFLGNPGSLTVPGNASGWLIMNHGLEHNGGVITGVNIIDANTGVFRAVQVSGTQLSLSDLDGNAVGDDSSIDGGGMVLKSSVSDKKLTYTTAAAGWVSTETMATKGLYLGSAAPSSPVTANCITFPDGTEQCTSATGCCSGISIDVTTIETALNGITGCGLSCTGVTGEFAFAQDVTFYEDVEFHDAAYFWEWTTFDNSISVMPGHTLYLDRVTFNCGGAGYTSIECTGNGNLNIPSGNVYINNVYQTGYFYDLDVTNNAYFTHIGLNQSNIVSILDIRSLNITDIDLRIQQIANQTAHFISIVDVNNNEYFTIDASGDANLSGCLNASGCITTTGDLTVGGDINVDGNLNVSGTLTYIDSTTVTIADKQLELASNSGTAIGNDASIDDGGIVLKSSDGDKKWTWQNNAYWDEWLSSEHVRITENKALRAGPTGSYGNPLFLYNWTNRGNIVLGDGPHVVPNNASGWLIMNHGVDHNGGVISGVKTIDAENLQIYSGDFRYMSISGTPLTFENVDGYAKMAGLAALSVLPSGASSPLEIKGASNAYISFPDSTRQTTSPTGDISTVSGLTVTNTTNIASTGTTNAANIAAATGDISTVSGLTVTNTTNIASTGTTNAANIAAATGDISTVSGLTVTNTTNIASTGTTNAANIATVSGLIPTYTASTGLTLVGTQFSTSGTGLFSHIQFGEDAGTTTTPIRIGNSVGGSDYSIAIGYKALEDIAATSTTNIGLGYSAGDGLEEASINNVMIGGSAGAAGSGDRNIVLGTFAGSTQKGDDNISMGFGAGSLAVGDKNIYIGYGAGYGVDTGSNNIDINVGSTSTTHMDGLDSKLNIHDIIRGDASTNRIVIGGNLAAGDYTPDATLEVKPKEHTDIGLIVQGDTSHSANLTEWQNSSETVLAYVDNEGSISGNAMTLAGHLAANTKSFLIDHPTKEGQKLQYASLEGPEHGVYVRGYTDENIISLPDYWAELVHNDSLTVHLTPKDFAQPTLFVSGILNNKIYLQSEDHISTYYTVNATRKDVDLLDIEPEG